MKNPIDPHPIILNLLSGGVWYANHEIYLQLKLQGCHVSADAASARKRDLRKPRFGRWDIRKRRREGTEYYEYRNFGPIETASKAA